MIRRYMLHEEKLVEIDNKLEASRWKSFVRIAQQRGVSALSALLAKELLRLHHMEKL
jgi:hypothetical protein